MTRRTRCATCNRLGCGPDRHCFGCEHLDAAHGFIAGLTLAGPFACVAFDMATDSSCECADYR